MIHFSYTWWFTNDMSTTHCGTNIVKIRVGLFNDILRFDYALRVFFIFCYLLLWFNCSTTCIKDHRDLQYARKATVWLNCFTKSWTFKISRLVIRKKSNSMIELLYKILNVQNLPPLTVQQHQLLCLTADHFTIYEIF